jgi:hypothetical protein
LALGLPSIPKDEKAPQALPLQWRCTKWSQ